jgi:predicted ATPase/class 3 adenylate cyclase
MENLPGGVVTFLFTDVEGSTRLARELGDALWAELLEEHRRILREAFTSFAGIEVDTQGDAFFVVFPRASDALAAAIDGQRRLERHGWPEGGRVRVRAGLHTGEAVAREGHYVGHEVHRASRICDAGHGGQILVSQTTAELVRDGLPADASLTDVGPHRLKDLGEPQRLFQLGAEGLPSDFPRLRSLEVPHNLPAERSSFVGREDEIASVSQRLGEARLVTLTGIGGSGKTRLALRVGAGALARFPDGVFFVDLAPVTEPELVTQTIAAGCNLSLAGGQGGLARSEEEFLVAALSSWKALLVLDNCEHLIDEVARLSDMMLEGCAGVVLLATSRESLGVDGEQVVQVPSLSVSGDGERGAEALHLFVERARAVKPGLALGDDNRAAIAEICERLDGIPLAIEFAAARVAHLSPQQIAERLGDRFRLLTGGRRRVERQQTLAAALDWSHELLDPDERALFRRLAVFSGSFSLEAAEAVCAAEDTGAGLVLDGLASLAAKSLVTAVEGPQGESRFRLLETVRMYAGDKLAAAGESEAFRSRHRDWALAWIEAIPFEHLSYGPESHSAVVREIDNLRAAADWCLADGRPDLLARLVTRLYSFWQETRGTSEEGARRCLAAVRQEERLSVDERVACHAVLSQLGFADLDHALASDEATTAIELADGAVSPFVVIAHGTRAFATSVLAAFPGADPKHAASARADLEAAHQASRSGLAAEWVAHAEYQGWMVETNLGAHREAAGWAEGCARTCGRIQEGSFLRPRSLQALAISRHLLGEREGAAEAAERARSVTLPPGAPPMDRLMLTEIAPALEQAGETKAVDELLLGVLPTVRRSGVPLAANHFLTVVGVVEQLRGRPERAGRLFAAVRYLGGAADLPIPFRTPGTMSFYRHYLPEVRAALGAEEGRRARDDGAAMPLEDALTYALAGLG